MRCLLPVGQKRWNQARVRVECETGVFFIYFFFIYYLTRLQSQKSKLWSFLAVFDFDLILLDLQKGRNLIQSLGDAPLHYYDMGRVWECAGKVEIKKKYIQSGYE